MSTYPPIAHYGLIGDGRTAALIGRDGSLDWLCLPNLDSPSIFAAVLDAGKGGRFQIAPAEAWTSSRRYVDGTAVLETTFVTPGGSVALSDFMPVMEESEKTRILCPLRQIIRTVRGVRGAVPMRLVLDPHPDYATSSIHPRLVGPRMARLEHADWVAYLGADVPLHAEGHRICAEWTLKEGETCSFSLAYSEEAPAVLPWTGGRAVEALNTSVRYWTRWLSHVQYDGPYRAHVLRGALVLKLLSFAPSGAIVAAPTTSLPERIGGDANYDYRFCWIRDASLTVSVLLSLGLTEEARAFVGWLAHAVALTRPRLRVLYRLFGLAEVPERTLDHLEGYRGSKPVRIGNAAAEQFQMDVNGELVDALSSYIRLIERPPRDLVRMIGDMADFVAQHWHEPDHGIWEARAEPRAYTHSRVMCWVALERALRLPGARWSERRRDRWLAALKDIEAQVRDRGFNPTLNAYPHALGGDRLDASVLLMAIHGFVSPTDPRMAATIASVRDCLTRDGLVYRHLAPDGGPPQEGSFVICTFWLAQALALQGRVDEARTTLERGLRCANDIGLMGEEFDPDAAAVLGNFPQAFSHIGLISAALAIARAEGQGT